MCHITFSVIIVAVLIVGGVEIATAGPEGTATEAGNLADGPGDCQTRRGTGWKTCSESCIPIETQSQKLW